MMNYATLDIQHRGIDPPVADLHRATTVRVTDCRDSDSPFVTVVAGDDGGDRSKLFLDPDLARQLHRKLGKLFPGDDVAGAFKALFDMELTCDNLEELRTRLTEPVDFPAAVDPVAAIERKEYGHGD